ncbi:LacI family DNA-binding transcriptional regulator [Paenibacillus sp. 1P07SE]|uniref:LacI family DNA-binding transcriptional regulator n=1 Tax=Paenibacillus sp. 1P07SE TaxID=3132209 RepID=UPI0039A57145
MIKIEDIAKYANVSKSAVSLALNGKPGISQQTRANILRIVKETGYVHRTSRTEKQHATGTALRFVACTHAGIVLEHFNQQPFFMELIHYIEDKCRKRGLSLLVHALPADEAEAGIAALEQDQPSQGIILLGTNLTKLQVEALAARHRNLIVLDTCHDTLSANFVVMNNTQGAHQAAGHLAEQGHKRIGLVQSQVRMHNFDARKQGFLQALASAGQEVRDEDVFTVSPTVVTSQPDLVEALRSRLEDLPTALFCECDYIAISVIKTLGELGLRVPHDISVVGFDNIHESVVISPELTTIHVEKEAMAELAVARLMEPASIMPGITSKTVVDTRLVVRKSSQAPPVASRGSVTAQP